MNESNITTIGFAFVFAVLSGALSTYVVRHICRRHKWISPPDSHHIHTKDIPRFGGVGVFIGFAASLAFTGALGIHLHWISAWRVFVPATLLFFVGVVDDRAPMRARSKLFFQILAATLLFLEGVRLFAHLNPIFGSAWIPTLVSYVATVSWVVLITNGLNLVDGLDGLAAGSAVFSLLTLFGLALVGGNIPVAVIALILAGVVLGFLRYNFNPATIFLGDGGSLFLGFTLSGLALFLQRAAAPTLVVVATPLICFGLPVVETGLSILRRLLRGKPIFTPDRDHIHHRLMRIGLSHRQSVVVLYAVCGSCALVSLFLQQPNQGLVGLVLLVALLTMLIGVQHLGYPEFLEFGRIAKRTLEQKSVIANDVLIRTAAQMLETAKTAEDINRALGHLLECGEFDYCILEMVNGVIFHLHPRSTSITGPGSRSLVPAESSEGTWSMNLDLISHGAFVGHFSLGRAFRRRSVLIDSNIVLGELEPALSAASYAFLQSQPHQLIDQPTPTISRHRTLTTPSHTLPQLVINKRRQ